MRFVIVGGGKVGRKLVADFNDECKSVIFRFSQNL